MATPRLNRMGLLLLPRTHIEKSQGCTAYRPLLLRQVRTSHRRFIKTEGKYIPSSPTDSLNTNTEKVNSCTVKCLGTGLTSSAKHPQVEHQTWITPYQPNKQVEQHIIRSITEGSAIAVRERSFKE